MSAQKGTRFFYLAVLFIPLLNGIATSTVNFFPPGTINPGTTRAMITLLIIGFISVNYFPVNKTSIIILIAIVYWGILSLFSSAPSKSVYEYIKFAIPLFLFPVGYIITNTQERLKGLTKAHLWVLIIFLADIFLSNLFGYGRSDYMDDSFYFGSARVNITKSIIVLLFIFPIAFGFASRSTKRWVGILFITGLLVALVGIKRSVLISAILALIIYWFLSPYKGRIIKLGLVIAILLLSVLSFYLDLFVERFQARGDRVSLTEETIETEARYSEVFIVANAWVKGSVKHKLIGSELFNDSYFFRTSRMLHTDYMIILNGSGLIGLGLWFLILILIIKEKNRYYGFVKSDKYFQQMNTVFWMLLSAQVIISLSGTVYDITLRSIIYIFLGAIVGCFRTRAIEMHEATSKQPNKIQQNIYQS